MGSRYWYVGALSFILVCVLPPLMVCQDTANEKLSNAANCFTLNLYKQLVKSKNKFVSSPFSLDVLLSILRAGSGGRTQQELTDSLGYEDLSVTDMEGAFKSKLSQLTSSDDNTLEVANSIWIQEGYPVEQSFKDIVTNDFYAQVENIDFAKNPAGAANEINSWASNKTHGLIPKLIDGSVDPHTLMALVNAIYFKGEWAWKFDSDKTEDGNFYNNDSNSNPSNVKLMNQHQFFKYYLDSSLKAQVLEMDYKGGDMSMQIFLPQEGSNIANVESALTCENFKAASDSGLETLVDVTLPKFEIETAIDLNGPIMDLGMEDMFKDSADFFGIGPDIKVSEVIQKAIIKVYEEGSEAAAVTGIGGEEITSVFEFHPEIVYFRADHPFIFTIRNKVTNLVLFMGRVGELPNAS